MKKSDQPSRQRIVSFEEKDTPFADLGFSRKLPANTTFIQPGEMLRCCYYVKSGIVVAGELSENGVEHEFNIMEENSLIGEVFLFTNTPSPVSFRTVKDTELICIEWETMKEQIDKDPFFAHLIMESLATKFLSAMDELRQTTSHNATWRICNLLLIFAEKYGQEYDGKVLIVQKLSQQMMSTLLGINRITTVRIIKTLKDMRLIEQINGMYCIRSMDKLREYQEANSAKG